MLSWATQTVSSVLLLRTVCKLNWTEQKLSSVLLLRTLINTRVW